MVNQFHFELYTDFHDCLLFIRAIVLIRPREIVCSEVSSHFDEIVFTITLMSSHDEQ